MSLPNPYQNEKGEWFFYDETFSDWLGPFRSKENAEKALYIYCQQLEGIQPTEEYPDRDIIKWDSESRYGE